MFSKIIRKRKNKSEKIKKKSTNKKILTKVATASQTALHFNFCLSSKVLLFTCLFLFQKNVDIFREHYLMRVVFGGKVKM